MVVMAITAKVGTMNRKRQLRNTPEHLDKRYSDDIFDSTYQNLALHTSHTNVFGRSTVWVSICALRVEEQSSMTHLSLKWLFPVLFPCVDEFVLLTVVRSVEFCLAHLTLVFLFGLGLRCDRPHLKGAKGIVRY